jgi:anti-sigma factor RsiW
MTGRVLQFDSAVHRVTDVLLPWFVNGTLEGDELAFVREHLDDCERCRHEVEWLREIHAACVAGAAAPGAANALRNLRNQLEAPRHGRRTGTWWGHHWTRLQPWSRWVIAAQTVVIVALGTLWLAAGDGLVLYRMLGARNAAAPAIGSLVVVFDPATTESDLRQILRRAGARVVDGPTQANAYVLDVPAQRQDQAVNALRAEPAVRLVEGLGPAGRR